MQPRDLFDPTRPKLADKLSDVLLQACEDITRVIELGQMFDPDTYGCFRRDVSKCAVCIAGAVFHSRDGRNLNMSGHCLEPVYLALDSMRYGNLYLNAIDVFYGTREDDRYSDAIAAAKELTDAYPDMLEPAETPEQLAPIIARLQHQSAILKKYGF